MLTLQTAVRLLEPECSLARRGQFTPECDHMLLRLLAKCSLIRSESPGLIVTEPPFALQCLQSLPQVRKFNGCARVLFIPIQFHRLEYFSQPPPLLPLHVP